MDSKGELSMCEKCEGKLCNHLPLFVPKENRNEKDLNKIISMMANQLRKRWGLMGFLRRLPYEIGLGFRKIIWKNPLVPERIEQKLSYISRYGFGRMKHMLGKRIILDKETTEKIIRFAKWQDKCNKKGK